MASYFLTRVVLVRSLGTLLLSLVIIIHRAWHLLGVYHIGGRSHIRGGHLFIHSIPLVYLWSILEIWVWGLLRALLIHVLSVGDLCLWVHVRVLLAYTRQGSVVIHTIIASVIGCWVSTTRDDRLVPGFLTVFKRRELALKVRSLWLIENRGCDLPLSSSHSLSLLLLRDGLPHTNIIVTLRIKNQLATMHSLQTGYLRLQPRWVSAPIMLVLHISKLSVTIIVSIGMLNYWFALKWDTLPMVPLSLHLHS